jgi:hypothetical protein
MFPSALQAFVTVFTALLAALVTVLTAPFTIFLADALSLRVLPNVLERRLEKL